MTFELTDLTPRIASQISVDLPSLISGKYAKDIREILEVRGVVVFRNLDIDDEQQVAIARTLGSIPDNEGEGGIYKISLDSDVNANADYLKGSLMWHSDGSLQKYPNLGALLRPIVLSTEGGQTEFANTYAAYDDLPEEDKRAYEPLRVTHSAETSQYYVRPEMHYEEVVHWQKVPTKNCPLVWRHQSGRRSLLLGSTCDYVRDVTIEESRALLAKLRDWATQPQYVYRHEWQLGDLLIWDNTGTMHRALPYAPDSGRLMHRTILAGEEPLN